MDLRELSSPMGLHLEAADLRPTLIESCLRNIALLEHGLIQATLTDYLGYEPSDEEFGRCSRVYTYESPFDYSLYYDADLIGHVQFNFMYTAEAGQLIIRFKPNPELASK